MKRHQPTPLLTALGNVDLFSDLDAKELAAIGDLCREETFQPGDAIVSQGDSSARFYLIHSGEVEVFVHDKPVGRLGPNEYFGEIAVIDQMGRSADVRARTAVTASSIASFNLRALLKEHVEIAFKLLLGMCARVRKLEEHAGS
jgi:CRP/FNR family transcriptional regulator, cyclic AMP receptor protein